MSGSKELTAATLRVDYANCFWATDAMLYGDAFANRQIRETENELREVAAQVIETSTTMTQL